jgi:hypothetical protein
MMRFFFLFLFCSSVVFAFDAEGFVFVGGDSEGMLTLPDGLVSGCEGFNCSVPESNGSSDVVSQGAGASRRWYDLVLGVLDDHVSRGSVVKASAALLQFGDEAPMQDGVLSYYVVSPSGESLPLSQLTIREGSSANVIEYALPYDSEIGVWQLVGLWEAQGLSVVESKVNFVVENGVASKVVLTGLVCSTLVVTVLLLRRRRRKD